MTPPRRFFSDFIGAAVGADVGVASIGAASTRAATVRRSMTVRRHVFVCTNSRPDGGRPACAGRGSVELCGELTREVLRRRLGASVAVTTSGCLGPCFDGPNLVIFPDGTWYQEVSVADVPAIVDHLAGGPPVAHRLRAPDPTPDEG